MDEQLSPRPRKGRGSVSNAAGRFEAHTSHAMDDGWGSADQPAPALRTTLTPDASRTVIARNTSPDVPFDRSLNPYRGCEHGCIYCFARPTHAYLGLSPGLDFESRLFYKPDAAKLLAQELGRPGYRCAVLAMGTNTDPYQPAERDKRITRDILEVLRDHNHPVGIVTKSALVLRDIDILAPMAERGLAQVCVSVTTLDRSLARRMEPRAATPARRLDAISGLSAAGIPTGVMAAPVIPALTDHELENILAAAHAAGADFASYIVLRLPLEIADLFREWLDAHAPLKADRVMSLMRSMHGGKIYDSTFGRRMKGTGAYAEQIAARFRLACERLGLDKGERFQLDATRFRVPPGRCFQLSMFGSDP